MDKFTLAACGIFGICNLMTAAHAQPLQAHDWSGAYLGANIGAAKGQAETAASTSDGFAGSYFTQSDPEQIAAEADGSLSQASPAVGLFGGFGQQFGNLYLGIEASANSLSFDESHRSGAVYLSSPASEFSNELSVTADWQAMLRARLGWAQERWLVYMTGGAAITQIKLDASFADNFLGTGARGRDSSKETKLGWVLGLGGEYALSESWAIRGEYLYADYGKVDTSAQVTNPAFPTLANQLKSSAELKTQTLSAGLSYRF